MFEVAETGQRVSKARYAEEEPALRTALLAAQRQLRERAFPLIILVAGVEGAGKGEVVNELNRWFDARGVRTHAFWEHSDEERERPRFWRFWRTLPPKSTIGIMFGSWYTEPIVAHAFEAITSDQFARDLDEIATFERLLSDDGALIVKFWFHLSKKVQKKRLKKDKKAGRKSPLLVAYAKKYERFRVICKTALAATDSSFSPWHIIDAADRRHRNLAVGETLLAAIEGRLGTPDMPVAGTSASVAVPATRVSELALGHVDVDATIAQAEYYDRLEVAQNRLAGLAWRARAEKVNTVCVFEGWDAAGKGGAIRRITGAIDARLLRVIAVAAPTDEERAQHYLWRFWRQLPRAGYCIIYDRSWYGRVLVERVENFCSHAEWSRAYAEINDFERQLGDNGAVLLKFWLEITAEEQLRRFEERQRTAWKQHKITDEDWRNRAKWQHYHDAANAMLAQTNTDYAPWTLVSANDKRFARVTVLETLCERLADALERPNAGTNPVTAYRKSL